MGHKRAIICKRYLPTLLPAIGTKGQPYTHQIQRLQAQTPEAPLCLTAALVEITTPLCWEEELTDHLDEESYMVNQGFRLGYDRTSEQYSKHDLSPAASCCCLKQELLLDRGALTTGPIHPLPYKPLWVNSEEG